VEIVLNDQILELYASAYAFGKTWFNTCKETMSLVFECVSLIGIICPTDQAAGWHHGHV